MKGLLADPDERPVDEPLSAPPNWKEPPATGEARAALKFIQNCPHTKGELREQEQRLGDTWLPWQERLTRHLFGTVNGRGYRRYRTAYIEMPKKSGKSHWLAAVMLYLLGPGTKHGAELYSAAYDHGQAMIVWGIARQMCKIAGWDQGLLQVRDYQGCWEIENPKTDSQYEPLTRKAASKHGFNPYAVAFDELHQQPDRELWDTIDGSMGAWDEPLLIAITNSGHDRQSICYKKREYAIDNNREGFDDSFFGVVYGVSEGFEGVGEEADWKRANPGVPVTVDLDKVGGRAETAARQPSELNSFQRWQLGIWTQAATRWIDPPAWESCYEDYSEDDLLGWTCYGGLDLGVVRDLSAWVLLFRRADDRDTLYSLPRVFCPRPRVEATDNPYRDQYAAWEKSGDLIVTKSRTTDHDRIRQQVLDDASRFDFRDMAMDRYQGIQLSKQLASELGGEDNQRVAGMGQGYASMTGPTTELERRIYADPPTIRHNGHPVLTWAMQNVGLQKTENGDKQKPVNDNPDGIIDPVVALLMALDRAVRWEDEDAHSVYEKHGIRTVGAS